MTKYWTYRGRNLETYSYEELISIIIELNEYYQKTINNLNLKTNSCPNTTK